MRSWRLWSGCVRSRAQPERSLSPASGPGRAALGKELPRPRSHGAVPAAVCHLLPAAIGGISAAWPARRTRSGCVIALPTLRSLPPSLPPSRAHFQPVAPFQVGSRTPGSTFSSLRGSRCVPSPSGTAPRAHRAPARRLLHLGGLCWVKTEEFLLEIVLAMGMKEPRAPRGEAHLGHPANAQRFRVFRTRPHTS